MKQAIPYYRVSTLRQGRSGLGLDAQQKSIEDFAQANNFRLLQQFTEVESGSSSDRPVLAQALKACKKQGAVLLIAKLDRLARNVAFVSRLLESDVRIIAADHPWVDDIILHILAAFAQYERKMNSERTKAALAAARLRGVQLGRFGKEVLAQRNRDNAKAFALSLQPLIEDLRREGFTSIRMIAEELNKRGVLTYYGGNHHWHIATVHHLIKKQKQHS